MVPRPSNLQDITMAPSTNCGSKFRHLPKSPLHGQLQLDRQYRKRKRKWVNPLICTHFVHTILHYLMHHRFPSLYARYLPPPPLFHTLYSGTLPSPPLTVYALYLIKHPFHHPHRLNTTLTQACIPIMFRLLCSRFLHLTGSAHESVYREIVN